MLELELVILHGVDFTLTIMHSDSPLNALIDLSVTVTGLDYHSFKQIKNQAKEIILLIMANPKYKQYDNIEVF